MNDNGKEPIDQKRYFNDPEYRKKILQERKNRDKQEMVSPTSKSIYKKIAYGLSAFGALMVLFAAGYIIYLFTGLPSAEEFENPDTAIASEVRSRDGVVIDRYFTENRKWVKYEDISPNVIDALVATED